MDIDNWIEEVHRNKHNMIPVVKLAISKPIEALLVSSNLTDDFPKSLKPEIEHRKSTADKIMSYLSAIGNTSSGTDEQVSQLKEQTQYVANSIIPQIKDFELFYSQFKDKDFYFTSTEDGQRALGLVMKAPARCLMSCQGLSQLCTIQEENNSNTQNTILIDVIEEVFDDLENVNVIYNCSNRDIKVCIDKSDFESNLLLVLAENIKRHAFPHEEYKDKLVIDKLVEIKIEEDSDKVLLRISNNGIPFHGNADKLFVSGYHAGKYGRTGFGLASAKSYLKKIGGDIKFIPTDKYPVSFLISIPKKQSYV